MNNRPKPPSVAQSHITVNLNELPTVGCPTCQGMIFTTNIALFKELTAIQSPTGQAQMIKVDLCQCYACDEIVQPVGSELRIVEVAPISEN